MVFSSPLRLWLLPSAVLLTAMAIWGAVRYPNLPTRIPAHMGIDGVDAWTDRSIGSAFTLVIVYAGVTVLVTACAELTLRVTPRAELPDGGAAPFAGGLLPPSALNRPAGRAAARRIARALLLLNACIGLSLLVGCGVLWRSTPVREVPGWLFSAMIVPFLAGTALTVAAAAGNRKDTAN
ncbi:DUF1648 domain-containing protein [Streptomyces decoyicus]|uniref:DUF1648 domain-containing protein n=1 Tax=Streptomyces decoyicus TaxID=249567 RepID=UPI0004AB45F5|nr:DUF1648 domain-containing protein [Streptomyces decoyicus]KOG41936.1 hypothetical protein ADK74_18740 [Streptomyces decoyicus]QZY14707.1 DUF1648 domain-containing protein [Streptomyces decoyicus]